MCISLFPAQEDTEDEGTMDVGTEAWHPGVETNTVAEKQAGILPF